MTSSVWDNVSDSAKNLIRGLLEMDPEKRLSAKEALESEWIKGMSNGINNERVNSISISSLFPNANPATINSFVGNSNSNNSSNGDTPCQTSIGIEASN